MKSRLLLVALVALVCTSAAAVVASAGVSRSYHPHHRSSDEVWLVDQEDKFNAGAGTLYVFDGRDLTRDAARAVPEKIDLAGAVRTMCEEKTGTTPLRPHMIVFNGGDNDGPGGNTYAALAFVASGLKALDTQGADLPGGFGEPASIGELLLTDYLVAFEAASYLLLVAAVGAVVLARRRRGLEDMAAVAPRSEPPAAEETLEVRV